MTYYHTSVTIIRTLAEVNLWALAVIGLFAGFLGATLGVGGGFLIVPILTLALNLPMQIAVASSLIAIVATSCTAASIYAKSQFTNIRLGLLLETTTTPGAIIGALTAAFLASSILSVIFGILLIYVAYTMIIRQPTLMWNNSPKDNPDGSSSKKALLLTGSYYDQATNKKVTYDVRHIPLGLGASFFAGILSSLLGIGGGIIKLPTMNLGMGVPMKAAIGTSSFMIAITTTVGVIVYYFRGYIYPSIVAPLIIGVFLGARLGAELAQMAAGMLLRRIFGLLIFITAILMFLKAANIL